MLSKIQDLDRFKQDCKRFELAIQGQEGKIKSEGLKLYNALIEAVVAFDDALGNLVRSSDETIRSDHVIAQEQVQSTKEAIERWMLLHAPNTHIDLDK